MSKQKYYYAIGNTSKGLMNYLQTNIVEIEQVIVLKHQSHTLKTAILRQIMKQYDDLEILCSPFGDEYIEGIIVRNQSLAIITDTIVTPTVKINEVINLNNLFPVQERNLTFESQSNECREKAYIHLSEALNIHDELETIYIQEMNFSKANELSQQVIEDQLKGHSSQSRIPRIYHRFFGTNTDQGPVNKLPQIIADVSNRIYIKGRAGTGKSIFMKKIATACEEHGFDIEKYHCSFDPDSIDMVLVPALDLCVFDSTAPHEFFPERNEDIIIDLYEKTVTPGTDEKYADEIKQITRRYKAYLVEGIESLKQSKFWQDKLEEPYKAIDQAKIDKVSNEVYKYIL